MIKSSITSEPIASPALKMIPAAIPCRIFKRSIPHQAKLLG